MTVGDNNLIIVAHPDDEVMWFGTLPLIYQDKNWTAIAVSTPIKDPIRAEFFDLSCQRLGIQAHECFPEKEEQPNHRTGHVEQLPGLHRITLDVLRKYDHVYTHGSWGEYGHKHHIQVHNFIFDLCKREGIELTCSAFNWRTHGQGLNVPIIHNQVQGSGKRAKVWAIMAYSHPDYAYKNMTKAQALLHRYYHTKPFNEEYFYNALP